MMLDGLLPEEYFVLLYSKLNYVIKKIDFE